MMELTLGIIIGFFLGLLAWGYTEKKIVQEDRVFTVDGKAYRMVEIKESPNAKND